MVILCNIVSGHVEYLSRCAITKNGGLLEADAEKKYRSFMAIKSTAIAFVPAE